MAKGKRAHEREESGRESEDSLSIGSEHIAMLKRYLPLAILLAILLWGYSQRAYHLGYPVLGYHNTKEAHTLGEALNFYRGESFLTPRQHYYTADDATRGTHGDNLPVLAWMIVLGWKVTGLQVATARFMVVLFSLGIITLTYILTRDLLGQEDLALLAALLAAACPILVFFGRNIQYDVPAAFFALGGAAAYVRWRKDGRTLWFALMAWSVALGAVSKWPTLIILAPILATFPYSRLIGDIKDSERRSSLLKQAAHGVIPFLLMVWWWFYAKGFNPYTAPSLTRDSLGHVTEFFTGAFWNTAYQYAITDNFSLIGVRLVVLGFLLCLLYMKKFPYRFLAAWGASFLVYGLLFADYIAHQNYYMAPYGPLWAILVAVFLMALVSVVPRINLGPLPWRSLRWVLVLLILWFAIRVPLAESVDRQFGTQFYGLDVAGEYIRANSDPGETILDSAHQDRGLLWHSDRELMSTRNVSEMMSAEQNLNLTWVFAYQWGIQDRVLGMPEIAKHVAENYTLKQFAFQVASTGQGQQVQEIYYLYQRGGSSPTRQEFLSNLSNIIKAHPPQQRVYENPHGSVPLYYITFE